MTWADRDRPAPLRPVERRVVEGALELVAACGCRETSRIEVLRGFDGASRDRAQAIRRGLGQRQDLAVIERPVSVVALEADHPRTHVCVFVDATDGRAEGDRVAARGEAPIVVARRTGDSDSAEPAPVLLASFSPGPGSPAGHTFPSVVGRVAGVALSSFLVSPNQPETGRLQVRAEDGTWRLLESGSSVRLGAGPEAMLVEAIDRRGAAQSWTATEVTLRQVVGLHRIHRDGLSVADLSEDLVIRHRPAGLRRHLV